MGEEPLILGESLRPEATYLHGDQRDLGHSQEVQGASSLLDSIYKLNKALWYPQSEKHLSFVGVLYGGGSYLVTTSFS